MVAEDAGGVSLFRFRPAAVGIDRHLREAVMPELLRRPGVVDVFAGRQGPDELGPRIVASVWDHADAGAGGGPVPVAVLRPPHLDDAVDGDLVAAPLRFGFRFRATDAATVMRVVEGAARPGSLDAYVAEARAGTLRDAEVGHAPLALYLATMPPDAFLTVSVWADWATVEAATGGSAGRPVATRHTELLAAWSATHYELLPAGAGSAGAIASAAT